MLLSTCWFGHRARELRAQLDAAAELGFAGIALLAEADPPAAGSDEAPAGPARVGAADWTVWAPPPSPLARPWQREALPAVQAGLIRARCSLLILPVGPDRHGDAAARGERLLERLRAGESIAGDEALEELRGRLAAPAERQLEDLAGLAHQLLRSAPGLRIALAPGSSPAALLTPARLRLLCAELRSPDLGLWHDTADAELRAAAGLEPAGAWLDGCGARIFGAALHDHAAGRCLLPPGTGTVDWALLAEYLPRAAELALQLAPSFPAEALAEARAALAAHRIPGAAAGGSRQAPR